MARPIRQGLEYFPTDITFLSDIRVRRIAAACGGQAVHILLSLLINTYRDAGYYLEWNEEVRFLVADEVRVAETLAAAVVEKALAVGFFDLQLFNEYRILTSREIQARYIAATHKRKEVRLIGAYLLVEQPERNNLVIEALETPAKTSPAPAEMAVPPQSVPAPTAASPLPSPETVATTALADTPPVKLPADTSLPKAPAAAPAENAAAPVSEPLFSAVAPQVSVGTNPPAASGTDAGLSSLFDTEPTETADDWQITGHPQDSESCMIKPDQRKRSANKALNNKSENSRTLPHPASSVDFAEDSAAGCQQMGGKRDDIAPVQSPGPVSGGRADTEPTASLGVVSGGQPGVNAGAQQGASPDAGPAAAASGAFVTGSSADSEHVSATGFAATAGSRGSSSGTVTPHSAGDISAAPYPAAVPTVAMPRSAAPTSASTQTNPAAQSTAAAAAAFTASATFTSWQRLWSTPNPLLQEQLACLIQRFGDELVAEAVKVAAWKSVPAARGAAFITGCLKKWAENNITTAVEAERYQQAGPGGNNMKNSGSNGESNSTSRSNSAASAPSQAAGSGASQTARSKPAAASGYESRRNRPYRKETLTDWDAYEVKTTDKQTWLRLQKGLCKLIGDEFAVDELFTASPEELAWIQDEQAGFDDPVYLAAAGITG